MQMQKALNYINQWKWCQSINIQAYRLLSQRWTEHSLPSLVEFGHDDILCLLSCGLGGEINDVWLVHLFVQFVKQEILKLKCQYSKHAHEYS